MKQNKILALLLAVIMVVGMVPSAWATEIVEAATPETTETAETAQTPETVEVEGEPAEQAETVLGTGTLNAGTLIYKEPNGESYMVQGTWINNSYAIDILEAEDVDGVTWYRYQPSGTGGSIIDAILHIFSTYPWVKAENIELDAPIVPPEEPDIEEIYSQWEDLTPTEKREIIDSLDEESKAELDNLRFPGLENEVITYVVAFADLTETLPETEIVDYFMKRKALDDAWGPIQLDSPNIPEEEQSDFDNAAEILDKALPETPSINVLSMNTEAEKTQVREVLDTRVNDTLLGMIYAYYDAEEVYGEGFFQYLEENSPSTVATYNTLSTYAESSIATYANNGHKVVGQETSNIKVHLFNYGYNINTVSNRVLGFTMNQNYDADSGGNNNAGSAHVWPKLAATENGYPIITGWEGTSNDGTGSLEYLFGKDLDYIAGTNGNSAGNSAYGASVEAIKPTNGNYQIKHFAVDHVQLFQRNGNQYVYDSALNAAQLEYENGEYYLRAYDYALRPFMTSGNGEANLQGHFLPFNTVDQAVQLVDENGNATNEHTKYSGMTNLDMTADGFKEVSKRANNLYALKGGTNNRADLAFGMTVEFDFNMPEGGRIVNTDGTTEDMVFEFIGDDDVLVYIDGKPVLNLGGGHGAVYGKINFATGDVTVYEQGSMSKPTNDFRCTNLKKIFELSDNTFEDYSTHSLQFFYLERFATNANCWLQFNMEPIPEGELSIQKKVEGINDGISEDRSYDFIFNATHHTADVQSVINQGVDYYIYENGVIVETKSIKPSETFCLKDGQTVSFNLPDDTEVIIEEIQLQEIECTEWMLNGQIISYTNEITCKIDKDSTQALSLTCVNTRVTTGLTINKTFSGHQYEPDKEYMLNLSFGGKPFTGIAKKDNVDYPITDGKITMKVGESITIDGIPTGMEYTLSESSITSTYLYANPKINSNVFSFGDDYSSDVTQNPTVAVENSHILADLIIRKYLTEGLVDDNQSFVFELTGGPADVNIQVVVNMQGDGATAGQVTIKDLPVGVGEAAIYMVKELSDWSWRYTLSSASAAFDSEATYIADEKKLSFELTFADETVTFTNTRNNSFWLSGDSWCRNWWGNGGTITREPNE